MEDEMLMKDEMFDNVCVLEGEAAKKFIEENNREMTEEEKDWLEECEQLYLRMQAKRKNSYIVKRRNSSNE